MFKKFYFKLELIRHYWRRYYIYVILGTTLGSLLVFFASPIAAFVIKQLPEPATTYGLAGLYTIRNLPPQVSQNISFGLMTESPTNRPEPTLLTKSISISPDGLTYRFELNPYTWQNGQRVLAQDLTNIYTINNASVTAPNDSTLLIQLEKPFSPLPSILTNPIFQNNQLIGVGDYRVTQSQFQDGYLKKLVLALKDNPKKKIIYRFYPSENDLITAFKLGEIDTFSSNIEPKDVINWKNSQVSKEIDTSSRYIALFFNTDKLSRKQFRQSLSYATPKPRDKNERCLGPISPQSWAFNPQTKEYNYNPTRAKELVDSEDPKKIVLSLATRDLLPEAEKIKQAWGEILGITVDINTDISPNRDFEVLLSYGNMPLDPDQYAFWHSTQTKTNHTHLNNSRIDKLLEGGRQTMDNLQRKQIYFDFQKYLLEEAPAVFISFPTRYTVSRLK
ncbi:MAG: ABC transporter substrate-binding protein [Candidatus Shapirobacteria bacterium]